jgi:hypothetical protein
MILSEVVEKEQFHVRQLNNAANTQELIHT